MNYCINCNEETINNINICNDYESIRTASSYFICEKCVKPKTIGESRFVKIKEAIYEYLEDKYGIWESLVRVKNREDFECLINKTKYDFLRDSDLE